MTANGNDLTAHVSNTGISNQTVEHVSPGVSRARVDHRVDSLRYALIGLAEQERRRQEAFDAAVSAELVACTLGARVRPELLVSKV